MNASSRFPTAVHMLMIIAAFQDEYKINSDLLAESTGVNPVTVRTIFGKLKKATLIQVSPGPGGVRLGAPPENITLYDIYSAVEEASVSSIFGTGNSVLNEFKIGKKVTQVMTDHFNEAVESMRRTLASTTLTDMLNEVYAEIPAVYPPWIGK